MHAIEQDIVKVLDFYTSQLDHAEAKFRHLQKHFEISETTDWNQVTDFEVALITAGLLEIRYLVEDLRWFGLVNFEKILPKIAQWYIGDFSNYVSQQIDEFRKSAHAACLQQLKRIEDELGQVSRRKASPTSQRFSLLRQSALRKSEAPLPLSRLLVTILDDNETGLQRILEELMMELGDELNEPLVTAYHLCTLNGSESCSSALLDHMSTFKPETASLNWQLINLGLAISSQHQQRFDHRPAKLELTNAEDQMIRLIQNVGGTKEWLQKRDAFGRLPLHHATHYGLVALCECILKLTNLSSEHFKDQKTSHILLRDQMGLSPLLISVLVKDGRMTELLLESLPNIGHIDSASQVALDECLITSVRTECYHITRLLLTSKADANASGHNDETALYLAVRSGQQILLSCLLDRLKSGSELRLDSPEASYGWTPLMLACVTGKESMVLTLLQHGANASLKDMNGWTANDHAAYRGHESIMYKLSLLERQTMNNIHGRPIAPLNLMTDPIIYHKQKRLRQPMKNISSKFAQIYISLGALDTYAPGTAVDLSWFVAPQKFTPALGAGFIVNVSFRCSLSGCLLVKPSPWQCFVSYMMWA